MGKKKCRGGACALKNLARAQPAPQPIRQPIFPQAAPPIQAAPQPRPYQAINPNPLSQLGQGIPQNYNPQASVQQMMAPLNQQNPAMSIGQQLQQNMPQQGQPQGQVPFYSPYMLQPQGQPMQQQQMQAPQGGVPMPNGQNTAIPQGQVLHPNAQQRGSVGRFFKGTKAQTYNIPLFNQFQNQALDYISQYGLEGLQSLLGQQPDYSQQQSQYDFAPIGNQELERFYSQTIPSIAERFTAMGGGQRSSAFQGALGQAGRGLGNDLAAQQQQANMQQQGYDLQRQQLQQGQYGMNQNLYTNLLNMGLRPQFETAFQPGKGGALPGLIQAGAKAAMAFI